MGGRAQEPAECEDQGGGGVQGDQEEESHEALSKKREASEKEIFCRAPPDKLHKSPTCHAFAHQPALLALD